MRSFIDGEGWYMGGEKGVNAALKVDSEGAQPGVG